MARFDLHMSYFQVARRFLLLFGLVYLLFLARISTQVADSTTFHVLTGLFLLLLLGGTYLRYAWFFRNSYLVVDDEIINWHRNGEDHIFRIDDISGIRLPNKFSQYYGLSALQLKFREGSTLNLDVIIPSYDDLVAEIAERMKLKPHLAELATTMEHGTA